MCDVDIQISIPSDNDGFILLKCPLCGEFFKLKPTEMEAEDVIEIWCPCCGLKSDDYLTDDVIELALRIAQNIAMDGLSNKFKKLEEELDGSFISLQVDEEDTRELETPIVSVIDSLEVQKYKCCKRYAKIKPLIKMCNSYCPYCGVIYDEFE